MTMFELDDRRSIPRRKTGVRTAGEVTRTYRLTVIAADVDGAVASAGGWLCDRVRAGWQVTVCVPDGSDVTALTVLGVHAEMMEPAADVLRDTPAAVAVDARVLRHDDELKKTMLRLVDEGRVEVTVWGTSALFGSDRRFETVRHQLSRASRAFKAYAMRASGQPPSERSIEDFVSTALWYPPDGVDLMPVPGR
ncbi:hypothetical protein PDG61_19475 [Mycolicibacterium sp. BiH015]|uniref:hypothetical protein n=1 Tax=Mycolicibacterium sp. BiH015 TaxID=3018808 RepID=UPI0022E2E397|nr:hypothetical protein [Mycolicibacterium sp. BiH015]MDA2893112.1 hypothetical protein [Mycolicibacterium sp. BiH015]